MLKFPFSKCTHTSRFHPPTDTGTIMLFREGDYWITPMGNKYKFDSGAPHPDNEGTPHWLNTLAIEPINA